MGSPIGHSRWLLPPGPLRIVDTLLRAWRDERELRPLALVETPEVRGEHIVQCVGRHVGRQDHAALGVRDGEADGIAHGQLGMDPRLLRQKLRE